MFHAIKEKPLCSLRTATAMLGALTISILAAMTIFAVPASGADKPAAEATAAKPDPTPTARELREVAGKLPSQSHTMMDVAYHFGNL
jgi:hypothetical protein